MWWFRVCHNEGNHLNDSITLSFLCIHGGDQWMSEMSYVSDDNLINFCFLLLNFRWTISWSRGPAPLELITLPRSSGNWAAGPVSVSRRRRRRASRQTEAAHSPVCLHLHRQMQKRGLTVYTDSLRLNRSGGWQEGWNVRKWRAESDQEDLPLPQLVEAGSLWNSMSRERPWAKKSFLFFF